MEGSDPTGYKSNKAKRAKRDLKLPRVEFPRHSPDLHPLDFFVWCEVERRMALQAQPKCDTLTKYKARLRRVAMSIPGDVITKAVASVKKRVTMVVQAKGRDIKRD